MKRFRRLSLATTVTTLALVAVGGIVRATGSGLGCPDWPRCHGSWIPPLEASALIEYSHRLTASIAIALIGLQAVVALRRHRRARAVVRPALLALALVFVQAGLGAVVVGRELDPTLVTVHFAVAMALVATVVTTAVGAARRERLEHGAEEEPVDPGVMRLARWTAGATAALLLAGAYLRGEGAGLAFRDWPLMDGRLVPALDRTTAPHFAHRALAAGVGVLLAWLVARAWRPARRNAAVTRLAVAAAALYLGQVLVGAAQVWTALSSASRAAHVALSSLLWAAIVAIVAVGRRPVERAERASSSTSAAARPAPAPVAGGATPVIQEALVVDPTRTAAARALGVARAYVQLAKPRIILLLLITTVPAMVLAAGGMPSLGLVLATLFGGTLAAGSANAFNMVLDRDIDSVMTRTRRRPIPSHRIEPAAAVRFAVALGVASFAFLTAAVNLLAALLSTSAILFYVLVYTIGLKRSTPQNIVVGGAAGAVPVLVGWAAVTGEISPAAWVMFGIVFLWTPPHFWALALRYRDDYARAGVPMMPVVRGMRATAAQILAYSALTVGGTLALWPVGGLGPLYGASAGALGAALLFHAARLWRDGTARFALPLFKFSIVYLALLFGAVATDRLVLA